VDGKKVPGKMILPSRCILGVHPFEIECLRIEDGHTTPIPKRGI